MLTDDGQDVGGFEPIGPSWLLVPSRGEPDGHRAPSSSVAAVSTMPPSQSVGCSSAGNGLINPTMSMLASSIPNLDPVSAVALNGVDSDRFAVLDLHPQHAADVTGPRQCSRRVAIKHHERVSSDGDMGALRALGRLSSDARSRRNEAFTETLERQDRVAIYKQTTCEMGDHRVTATGTVALRSEQEAHNHHPSHGCRQVHHLFTHGDR